MGRKWVMLEEAMGVVKPKVTVFQITGWARLALPSQCLCGGWGPENGQDVERTIYSMASL